MKKWTGNNRAKWHDYTSKCIYHITLMKSPEMPPFGTLAGDCSLKPGTPGAPYIKASPLGQAVKRALREIPDIHPSLRLYQYALMPDHLHMLLSAEAPLDEIIGRKIAIFKVRVNRYYGTRGVFMKGFNDQIIGPNRDLGTLFMYLRDNPYRLAVRRHSPDFFRRIDNVQLGGETWQAYGNLHLLDNPFKEQVVVHRADSAETRADNLGRWLCAAQNGGVLVSPFISKDEKEIRRLAEEEDGRIILICNEPFGERFKPALHDFDLCCSGRLLILAPPDDSLAELTRPVCLRLNTIAESIANNRY